MIPSSTPSLLIDEDARRRFEAAWNAGRPEPIEHFLPAEDHASYLPTLEELVAIELEFRWKSARLPAVPLPDVPSGNDEGPTVHAPRLEAYLARFPRLTRPEVVQRLQNEADQLRQRYGEPLTPTQYGSRFPVLGAEHPARAERAQSECSTRTPQEDGELSQTRDLPQRAVSPAAAQSEGQLVPGYEILDELGRGGMGVVYRARQLSLKRVVALKMILAAGHAGREDRARFRSEAEAVAHLQHANIVQVYEIGEHDGCPYFSLEYIDGGSLAGRLKEAPPRIAEAVQLTEALARAAHYAHQRGIVHRDLKPANILLTADGTPKITDFGLAKQLHEAGDRTRTGAIMGTPKYMAPEQAAGQSRTVGPATDVYALGVILYEMLTGVTPFRGDSVMDLLEQVRTRDPLPPSRLQPKVPRDLETICLKCLQKEPQRRYASAQELAADLRRFHNGQPIHARPIGPLARAVKWARRRPAGAALIGAGVLLVGLIPFYIGYLQYALAEERRATSDANRRESLSRLREEVQKILSEGEAAYSDRRFPEALKHFNQAVLRTGTDPAVADLRDQAEQRVRQTEPRARNVEEVSRDILRLQQFRRRLGEALYRETLISGLDPATDRDAAGAAAADALKLFHITADGRGPPDLDAAFYDVPERAEINAGCFQMLLVQAEAIAGAAAGRPESERQEQARQAQALLDRAATFGPDSQALHLRRARCLELLGQVEAAAEERRRAAALPPVDALDHFLAGIEMHRQGKPAEAEPLFEQALRLQSDHFWAQYFLAVCQLQRNLPSQARSNLTVCLGRRPDFVWGYLLRGFTLVEQQQYDAAAGDFAEALRRAGDDEVEARYAILVHRGVLHLRQKQLPEAEQDLREAIRLRPELFQAHVNLALVLLQAGRGPDALGEMNEAARLQPDLAALYRSRAHLRLQIPIEANTAEELARQRRQTEAAALEDLNQAIDRATPGGRSSALRDDYLERGRLLLRARRFAEACADAKAALAIDPGYAPAHRLQGQTLLELHDYDTAEREFVLALRAGPDAVAYRGHAAAQLRLGNPTAAVEDYDKALKLHKDAATYTGRGWARIALRAYRPAQDDFAAALKLEPRNAYALSGRGYAQVRLRKHREGTADADKAIEWEPQSPALLHAAARTYALAVAVLDADSRPEPDLRLQYEKRAGELLRLTLDAIPASERSGYWKRSLGNDPDLKAIRRSRGYLDLVSVYGPPEFNASEEKPLPK